MKILLRRRPLIACLQETKLAASTHINITNYTLHRKDLASNTVAHGGVAVLVHNSIPSVPLGLTTDLQAAAVTTELGRTRITICSLYIPPSDDFRAQTLQSLIDQLPKPFIIAGDLNAHSTAWGCRHTDGKGRRLGDFLDRNSLCLLNTGQATHLSLPSGTPSAIDMSVCTPTIFSRLTWEVDDDPCGSDHLPIWIRLRGAEPSCRAPRWDFRRADWPSFTSSAKLQPLPYPPGCSSLFLDGLNNTIIAAAKASIPRMSVKPKRVPVPWWSEQIAAAIKDRKRAYRIFERSCTTSNLILYKKAKARARKLVREAKRTSWCNYVTSINRYTPASAVWNKVHRIAGRYAPMPTPVLTSGGTPVFDPVAVANEFGRTFAEKCSFRNDNPVFSSHRQREERIPISFGISDTPINTEYSLAELKEALRSSRDVSPGPDDICNQMLTRLDENSLMTLLNFFNHIWTSHDFPNQWREATIVPILKNGKDRSNPFNYRPISLTSCVCKLFEKMVNARLMWFLEDRGILARQQCGFRRNRSTLDHLIVLDTDIRRSFLSRHHTIAIFFDIEKAYDTTWRHGILRKLYDCGIRGNMGVFLANFLQQRYFRVRISSALSERFLQEDGVPQGSVLSVALFAIMINDLPTCIPSQLKCSLFVDDFAVWCSTSTTSSAERQLQLCLDRMVGWSNRNGLRFSVDKTKCVHFCKKRKPCREPNLRLYNQAVPLHKEAKFLGLIFDRRLSYSPHIKELKDKCSKRMNLLKVISRMSYGADRLSMLRLYRGFIRSVFDYASVVYDGAPKATKKPLDTLHNTCIRLATGAFRTSRTSSMLVEANEPPLDLRRMRLSLHYALKVKQYPDHPAYEAIFSSDIKEKFLARSTRTRPLCIRISDWTTQSDIRLDQIARVKRTHIPPWLMTLPKCDLWLTQYRKAVVPDYELKQLSLDRISLYPDSYNIFTDGSKTSSGTACAFVTDDVTRKFRLPTNITVYTSELYAIHRALKFISARNEANFLILSDSLSSILSLRPLQPPTSQLLGRVQTQIHDLTTQGKHVVFMWIPSHVGIHGNEQADAAAREATIHGNPQSLKLSAADLKPTIHKKVTEAWQIRWNEDTSKFRLIKPTVGEWRSSYRRHRGEEVTLCRLRLGHIYDTHRFHLTGDPPPTCPRCGERLTVEHILITCRNLNAKRTRLLQNLPISQLLSDDMPVDLGLIRKFLRESGIQVIYNTQTR